MLPLAKGPNLKSTFHNDADGQMLAAINSGGGAVAVRWWYGPGAIVVSSFESNARSVLFCQHSSPAAREE